MPRFSPFTGARFDTTRFDLAQVTSPPYDVIDPTERESLARRHPNNAVHIDLPAPDDDDRYRHARSLLVDWLDSGVLLREPSPAFYGYRMSFVDPAGRTRRSTGVLGALDLTAPGEGHLLPHEHTTPKAKSDRLDLLRACRANLSAVWGLSPTSGLTDAIGEPDDAVTWSDDEGIEHTAWVIGDGDRQAAIAAAVEANPVVIADGHHRYETSLQYRDEQRAASAEGTAGDAESAMFLVVELVPDELAVLPIHRLLSGLDDGIDLATALDRWFEVGDAIEHTPSVVDEMAERGHLVLVEPGRMRALHPRPGVFDDVRDLDTVRLDTALDESLGSYDLSYQHGVDHVVRAVEDGSAQAGILVRPVTVAQIAATADGGERMPPKSTFFHPKPRTGVVFRVLDD